MSTALQKQLAAIAASSTHQLDLKAQKAAHAKSLLFEPRVAASQSFDSLYLLCHEGYRDLCALDHRFLPFSRTIFSEQSKTEDRTQMTQKENKELDQVLQAFITLVGSRLLLKPAEKALEWLVRRFRVHEYNTECLVLTYLPYHATPQFLALLSILPASPPSTLRFLHPYISSPTNLPRRTIVYTAQHTPAFFNALQAHMVKLLQIGHSNQGILSFWSSVTTEAIDAILEQSRSGRRAIQDQKLEELLHKILPALNGCLRLTEAPDAVRVAYMITIVLVTKADLGDKVLDSLLEAVVLSKDAGALDDCLMCASIIAEERSHLDLPGQTFERISTVPDLVQRIASLSKSCRIERLALGCAVAALETMAHSLRIEENRKLFTEIIKCEVLDRAQISVAMTALIQLARGSGPGSEEHAHLLDLATELSELSSIPIMLQSIVKEHSSGLKSLGITLEQAIDAKTTDAHDFEDEEMLDIADEQRSETSDDMDIPQLTEHTYLDSASDSGFQNAARAFRQLAVTSKLDIFLSSKEIRLNEADRNPQFLTFTARLWSSSESTSVRVAALSSTLRVLRILKKGVDFQHLLPYLLFALGDPSQAVRRMAAACVSTIHQLSAPSKSKVHIWGGATIYGKDASIQTLTPEQTDLFLSSAIVPALEECTMDPKLITIMTRELLETPQSSKHRSGQGLKASARTAVAALVTSHVASTPLLRVRMRLLPVFTSNGKSVHGVRASLVLPLIKAWCSLAHSDAFTQCENEGVDVTDADRAHIDALITREPESVDIVNDILCGNIGKGRPTLVRSTFDFVAAKWLSLTSESRIFLGNSLLDIALKEDCAGVDSTPSRTDALETLRNIKLDSEVLVAFLESVPSASQMPEGPPAKKRRKSSHSKMVKAEFTSPNEVSRVLRRLTLVLELIEGSSPGEHPALFRQLFAILDELQQLKQQVGSDLVHLQSLILSCLNPMISTIKMGQDQDDYQSAVRADLLIDCMRHSSNPQVLNAALPLLENLASWVPELVLHNLMPIFTFIGSTLLRQDDYSAYVIDQTISRIVPQLATSLRKKKKDFLQGVSDLLLSFTAAFEHIPQHRRLKLFVELAQTLGPEDSLSAIIALLVDRYPGNTTQQKFLPELLLQFEPLVTLNTVKGYLDLVIDAVASKRKISDTLFGLNEKQPHQLQNSLSNLLSSLGDLTSNPSLSNHIKRAFRAKTGLEKAQQGRALFASILESTVSISRTVSSIGILHECCTRVVANCLNLLPTVDLVKSSEILAANPDHQVQVTALKAVGVRAGKIAQNDQAAVDALLSFLPKVVELLQHSQEINLNRVSIGCIDQIIERFGKKNVSIVESVAKTICGSQALANPDTNVRVLSILCITSIISVLEDEAISLLPTVFPRAFAYLQEAIEKEESSLHNAVYTLLSDTTARLAYMFSREYLMPALELSHKSAAADLDEDCNRARQQFFDTISRHLQPQEVFTAVKATWHSAIEQGSEAASEHLHLVLSTIENQSKTKMVKASSMLFSLFLEMFKLRDTIAGAESETFNDEDIANLEESLVEGVIAMTVKLNDATFRPFFAQLVETIAPTSPSSSEQTISATRSQITLFKFLASFFAKFKAIVTPYSSYILDPASALLSTTSSSTPELRKSILRALKHTFSHDTDGFWSAPTHHTILTPLLDQLTTDDTPTQEVIPAIVELAACSASSPDNHRAMNAVLCRYMRAEAAHTRRATVLCEQALTRRLGEEWLGLLPEMLPFIAELREDDDEIVERETQRWIGQMEEVLGEDLEGMLE
ncbi:U3 small nucleolar RNA-associated protein 10 [Polyplosphaeria fusca]|uniref:U3 small nucleolar RNA-associated protein 10 n=1 Tax=Polyplosphaeria fusca TaxID=682080 RepID=A0A9P4QIJ4_9PLEO|nr:U3 small nucleolar RNA-associated protein 10 [Polyplosphaeria fusca]